MSSRISKVEIIGLVIASLIMVGVLMRVISNRQRESVNVSSASQSDVLERADWMFHVDDKFQVCEKANEVSRLKFNVAFARMDRQSQLKALQEEEVWIECMKIAHRDMSIPATERSARYDADYVAEATMAVKKRTP